MRFLLFALVLTLLVAASACGDAGSAGNTSGFEENATVSGSVYGETLIPVTWMAGTSSDYSFNSSGWSSDHTVVKIVDSERACGQDDFPDVPSASVNSLLLDLFDDPTQPDSRAAEPGTFEVFRIMGPISSSRRAIATFVHDAVVGTNFLMTAQSGTVTVLAVSADEISGTFDLVFNDDDRLTGSFDTSFCETPFPPLRINTPGNVPEMERLEINVQFAGASPAEVVLEANGTWLTTTYLSEIEDGMWQLDTPMPTGNYHATITANDEDGNQLCESSLAFELTKGSPVRIDAIVTCVGSL